MAIRVPIPKKHLLWAIERSGLEPEALTARFPQLDAWMDGTTSPTLKQLEAFARATHSPVGFFFLPEPPIDVLPIPDLRTVGDRAVARPSADLLEVVHLCQHRQEWYREFARGIGQSPLGFVGSKTLGSPVLEVAAEMRASLALNAPERSQLRGWEDALRWMRDRIDRSGVLVMTSGIVGNNTHRKLAVDEFRGFALVDTLAPLVFVNGADSKAAQMFTLAHELAHVWLGAPGVSELAPLEPSAPDVERWCNQVAAELLVPLAELRDVFDRSADVLDEARRLSKTFKVSVLVILRRLHDAGFVDRARYWSIYTAESERLRAGAPSGGGDFYLTQKARVGERFTRSVVVSTLEGHTLYRDALRLLGLGTQQTFDELALRLGLVA